MYITINDIIGEKRIDLSYSIRNFSSSKEIAIIRMLSNNVKYEVLKLRVVMNPQGPTDPISNTKKMIPSGTYAGRELLSMLEGIVELNQFVVDDQVTKTNKLKGITEMILKGEPQRENKLSSYERAFKMLENDMYIAGIGQVVLELLSFKVESGNHQRGISLLQKFSDIFGNMRLVPLKMTSHMTSHNFQILKIEIFCKLYKI